MSETDERVREDEPLFRQGWAEGLKYVLDVMGSLMEPEAVAFIQSNIDRINAEPRAGSSVPEAARAAMLQRMLNRATALVLAMTKDRNSWRRVAERLEGEKSAAVAAAVAEERATTGAEEWQPEPHITLFIDDLTALLNDCSQTGDWMAEFPAYVAVWAVRDLMNKAFAREIEWAATSDEIVQALRENGESL